MSWARDRGQPAPRRPLPGSPTTSPVQPSNSARGGRVLPRPPPCAHGEGALPLQSDSPGGASENEPQGRLSFQSFLRLVHWISREQILPHYHIEELGVKAVFRSMLQREQCGFVIKHQLWGHYLSNQQMFTEPPAYARRNREQDGHKTLP